MYTEFDRFMFSETKSKNKKYFYKNYLQCFSNKNVLAEHDKICLKINDGQTAKLQGGFMEFKNYLKQIPVPFKVKADFECISKIIRSKEGFYPETY